MWIIQQVESMDSSSKICNSDMFDMTISFGMMVLLQIIYVDFCLKGHLVSNYIEGPAPTIISCFSKDILARSWCQCWLGKWLFSHVLGFWTEKLLVSIFEAPTLKRVAMISTYMNWICWNCTLCHESRKWYAMYVWMYACMYVRMYTVQYTIIEAINTLNHTLPVTDFTLCHPDFTPGSESAAVQGLTLAPRNCVKTPVAWDVLFHSISQNTTCGIFSVLKMAVRYYEVPEVFSWVSWRRFIHTSFMLFLPPFHVYRDCSSLTMFWPNQSADVVKSRWIASVTKFSHTSLSLYTNI